MSYRELHLPLFITKVILMADWLPEHQRHLLYTFAHIDMVIDQLCEVLYTCLEAGPLELVNRVASGRENVVLASVAPIPEAVPRLAADALNQMRSAIEHALFAEVVHLTGRPLTPEESQAIEMPVSRDPGNLSEWFKHKRRRTVLALDQASVLRERIGSLQPYVAADERSHPLRVLAEYTNHTKNRMPAVAAVRLGTIVPDYAVDGLQIVGEYGDDSPLGLGDVLASAPVGVAVPMSIWPKLGIRRPHTGEWIVLMHELCHLEAWTRTIAIPSIVTGTTDVRPIPPNLNISRGHDSFKLAFSQARTVAAAERHQLRVVSKGLREDLPGILEQKVPAAPRDVVIRFVEGLSDTEALEVINRYMRVRNNRGEWHAVEYLRRAVSTTD